MRLTIRKLLRYLDQMEHGSTEKTQLESHIQKNKKAESLLGRIARLRESGMQKSPNLDAGGTEHLNRVAWLH